jgi:hypothetical protein
VSDAQKSEGKSESKQTAKLTSETLEHLWRERIFTTDISMNFYFLEDMLNFYQIETLQKPTYELLRNKEYTGGIEKMSTVKTPETPKELKAELKEKLSKKKLDIDKLNWNKHKDAVWSKWQLLVKVKQLADDSIVRNIESEGELQGALKMGYADSQKLKAAWDKHKAHLLK